MGKVEKASSSILLAFVIPDHEIVYDGDIGLTWKIPFSWTPSRGPFRATRFLVGNGNAKGAIALVLKSNQLKADQEVVIGSLPLSTKNVVLFQVVPWYIRSYLHTLKIFIDMKPVLSREIVSWMHVVPSEDRRSPGVMEMELMIPSNATVITLIIEFDKVLTLSLLLNSSMISFNLAS
jgi:phosphatidylinositol glycan class T